mgnify:CR=1 FL=1
MPTPEQIREKLKILPRKIRRVLVSSELSAITHSIAVYNGLNEPQEKKLIEIISYVLMEFEAKNNLSVLIAKNLSTDQSTAQKITSEIEQKIISSIDVINEKILAEEDEDLPLVSTEDTTMQPPPTIKPVHTFMQSPSKSLQNNPVSQPPQPKQERQSNVGNSFEQTILNQARAMRPAVAAGGSYGMAKPAVPANLPTGQSEPRKVHDYKGDSDPYREPLA